MADMLKEKVIRSISTEELERRWKAVREVMKEKKVDVLLIPAEVPRHGAGK